MTHTDQELDKKFAYIANALTDIVRALEATQKKMAQLDRRITLLERHQERISMENQRLTREANGERAFSGRLVRP